MKFTWFVSQNCQTQNSNWKKNAMCLKMQHLTGEHSLSTNEG